MSKITIDPEQVEDEVRKQVIKHISDKLNYSRTLGDLVEEALQSKSQEIENDLEIALNTVVNDRKFQAMLVDEFQHKIAKTLVSKLEGAVAQAVNTYSKNPILRSKMVIALENIVKENSKEN